MLKVLVLVMQHLYLNKFKTDTFVSEFILIIVKLINFKIFTHFPVILLLSLKGYKYKSVH